MEVFQTLTGNSDPVIAILASLVLVLSGVIVYQWNYTTKNTVPKWIWDEFVARVDTMMDLTKEIGLIVKQK